MPHTYRRRIHFADTDAAGVVFFARYYHLCHEAYEDALAAAGLPLQVFFTARGLVLPIRTSRADYLRPLACGELVAVEVRPRSLGADAFAVDFELRREAPGAPKVVARCTTEHVCLEAKGWRRQPLPEDLAAWVAGGEAAPVSGGPQP